MGSGIGNDCGEEPSADGGTADADDDGGGGGGGG